MYIKGNREKNSVYLKDLDLFKSKLKIGSRIKVKIRNPLDIEKKVIINAKVTHLFPHFALIEGKYKGRDIKRSIHYIDLYKAKKNKEPVIA